MNKQVISGLILITFAVSSCVNIATYEAPDSSLKPLQSKIKRIILHEDSIAAEDDSLDMRRYFFNALANRLSSMKDYEVIIIKTGNPLPTLNDNKGSIWITGNIWSRRTEMSGQNANIKSMFRSTMNTSSSWDVLEHLNWNQQSFMSFTNLYFIELTENPRLLRSVITASNFSSVKVQGDLGTMQNKEVKRVEFTDPDNKAKSFFGSGSTDARLAAGYHVVSMPFNYKNWQSSIKQLAEASVEKYFPVKQ